MQPRITKASPDAMKPKPTDVSKLGFGQIFTDHFFTMKYHINKGWYDPVIEPYRSLKLDPASMCFHYAQEIFESLKAYKNQNGMVYLFRPADNFHRMNASARRLCMPEVDVDFTLRCLKNLVLLDNDWIPKATGPALYIRAVMIATEPAVSVHPSNEYLFYIIMGPVGAYYPQGFNPTKIYVTREYVRAVRGGIGACKAAGNYAASLKAGEAASKMGYSQVLWLDALELKYVEEVGTSNIFFLIGDELITPNLSGSILPGITRDSVIKMAKLWNMKVSERPLSIDEIMSAQSKGNLKEAFASGTAAIISPIGQIFYEGKEYVVNDGKTGTVSKKLYNELLQIQYGEKEDLFGWRVPLTE
jgi:branched-chain amino acid aminotransferase